MNRKQKQRKKDSEEEEDSDQEEDYEEEEETHYRNESSEEREVKIIPKGNKLLVVPVDDDDEQEQDSEEEEEEIKHYRKKQPAKKQQKQPIKKRNPKFHNHDEEEDENIPPLYNADTENPNNLCSVSFSFSEAITMVGKQVHPELQLSEKALNVTCDFVYDLFQRICLESENICRLIKRGCITSREIQTATRLVLPGELAKHGVSEGTKAVTKWNASTAEEGEGHSGLTFPENKIAGLLKEHWLGRVGVGSGIYLAAVLEYMCAELLELSGNAAKEDKDSPDEIKPRHIMLAIRNDEEFNRLCRTAVIPDCGALPHIIRELVPPHQIEETEQVKRPPRSDDEDRDDEDREDENRYSASTQVY